MILRSEEVRSVVHQVVDVLFDSGILIMETTLGPKMEQIFAVKMKWMGMKIPMGKLVPEDTQNPS